MENSEKLDNLDGSLDFESSREKNEASDSSVRHVSNEVQHFAPLCGNKCSEGLYS